MATVAAAVTSSKQPTYDTFTPRLEPQFAREGQAPSVVDNIERAIQSHHDRMAYYRQLSGQNDAMDEVASLQSEPERPKPTLWQSLWGCLRCRD